MCVRSTASDALYHGYNVICLSDGTTSQDEEMHVAGLRDMALFGKIMTVDEYKTRGSVANYPEPDKADSQHR